ncbi:hypothetical protein HaLaN_21496 [Haematococcus lacustris]|uniref:Guanylate cyclase domain-containing protein n=1 Tax=Haematococcus lacustris TaxID=44745 RepID=A0A699ZYN1_HAELA|nr:hypothetical protein HaLaN_21496 [Haematococcus lacustris]
MLPRDMPRSVYACFKVATLGLVLTMLSMAPVGAAASNATATASHCFTGTAEFVASVVDRHSAAINQTTAQFEQFLRDSTNSLLSECADGAEPLRPLRLLTQAGLVTVMTRLTQSFTAVVQIEVSGCIVLVEQAGSAVLHQLCTAIPRAPMSFQEQHNTLTLARDYKQHSTVTIDKPQGHIVIL